MESTTVLRQNHTLKKKNKENVQPAQEVKSFIKQNISKAAQLQTNGNKKEILTKTVKAPAVRQAPRKQNVTEQASGKTTTLKNPATAKKQDTGALIRKTEPTPAPPTSRAALGLYKGKIIESKIGSIWKSSAPVRNEEQKPTATNDTKPKATSAADRGTSAAGRGTSAAGRGTGGRGTSASVKPAASSLSARPPVRSVPTTARPRNATVAQGRRCGTLIAKPQVPVTDVKKSRPPVTSTVGQYRANNETEEEKRAKLAEWLASKGKTLKRPAMVPSGVSTKVKMTNKPSAPAAAPKAQTKAQVSTKSRPAAEVTELRPVLPAVAAETDKRTSLILNTTLDLLESSDADLPGDSQDGGRVDDIVMNLCDALEALEPPSQCDDELPQLKDEISDGSEASDDGEQDVKCESPEKVTMKKESPEKVIKCETPEKVMVESEAGVSEEQEEQEECEESDDDCYVDENEPPAEDASVVKYSVKTTPFLQSVKKTIDDEVCCSSSKRKSNIKDLKFLTPVRRSSRIHRQSSRLPLMLVDHDPCVSSLAELVQLDDDPNAYIYRRNPALLEDLPDQPRV